MEKFTFVGRKKSAQAMVEFAIALPILLLLLYGILEAGRYVFIYSSIVTASRQAVRYGSATGQGISGVPRYQDCAGIRQAAQRADYLNAFTDEDINIQYDSGPGTSPTDICYGSPLPATWTWEPSSGNTTRLLVNIKGDFNPIVPKLIPFARRSVDNTPPNPIRGESARTILVSVAIVVTDPPRTWIPPTPTATATRTFTPTFTPSNTPTDTPTPVFSPTPSSTATMTLSPTVTNTFTATVSPTITLTPTIAPTPVKGCTRDVTGTLTPSGYTLTMTITNPYNWPITTGDGSITWNNDKGHQTGNDKTLQLLNITANGALLWDMGPTPLGVSTVPFQTPFVIPPSPGAVTIVFTFDQTYDNPELTDSLLINVTTPGCEGIFIKSK